MFRKKSALTKYEGNVTIYKHSNKKRILISQIFCSCRCPLLFLRQHGFLTSQAWRWGRRDFYIDKKRVSLFCRDSYSISIPEYCANHDQWRMITQKKCRKLNLKFLAKICATNIKRVFRRDVATSVIFILNRKDDRMFEYYCLLRCGVLYSGKNVPKFRRYVWPPSSG